MPTSNAFEQRHSGLDVSGLVYRGLPVICRIKSASMQAFLVMPISDKSMASAHVAICIAYLSAICLRAFAKALSLSSGKSNWQSVRNFDSILPYLSTKLMTHLFVYPASSWHSFANALMCQSGVYLSVNIIGSYLQMTLFLSILFANFLNVSSLFSSFGKFGSISESYALSVY